MKKASSYLSSKQSYFYVALDIFCNLFPQLSHKPEKKTLTIVQLTDIQKTIYTHAEVAISLTTPPKQAIEKVRNEQRLEVTI
jgi:ArsR family metal-binding transcriptional regulator